MKTIKTENGIHTIIKQEGRYTLLAKHYKDGTFHEYVVCSDYRENGSWEHGSYFWHDLGGAIDDFRDKTDPNYISRKRLRELAKKSLHALVNEDVYAYYKNDLMLDENEIEYFGIEIEKKDNNYYESMVEEISYIFNEDEEKIDDIFRELGILL